MRLQLLMVRRLSKILDLCFNASSLQRNFFYLKDRRYRSLRRCCVICFIVSFSFVTFLFKTTGVKYFSLDTLRKSFYSLFHETPDLSLIPRFRAHQVNCAALLAGAGSEQNRTMLLMKTYKPSTVPDESFTELNCASFLQQRRYITSGMTDEEIDFPIAYSIVVYKDLGQVERLLRSIYRPQNAYCIHADSKSSTAFQRGIRRIVSCFPNVVMADRSVDVQWGKWSVLEADLLCMIKLFDNFPKWKYLINLTGQEFPLRTNLELVRILKAFNGSNNMEGTVRNLNRNREPPTKLGFKVTWTKGAVHIVAKRAFFGFMLNNNKSLQIAKALRAHNQFPDETYFSTLNHNPSLGTPGAYLGEPEGGFYSLTYPFLGRLKDWGAYPCYGIRVRGVCVWGVLNLPFINKRPEMFINKLYWNYQPFTLDCLEERIFNHTRRDYGVEKATSDQPLNINFYRNFSFVWNHQ